MCGKQNNGLLNIYTYISPNPQNLLICYLIWQMGIKAADVIKVASHLKSLEGRLAWVITMSPK